MGIAWIFFFSLPTGGLFVLACKTGVFIDGCFFTPIFFNETNQGIIGECDDGRSDTKYQKKIKWTKMEGESNNVRTVWVE